MKILLTGAGGQLGMEWRRWLMQKTRDHVCYNSLSMDITDYGRVDEVLTKEAPHVCINCAAYTAVDKAEEEQAKADLVNHVAVKNLAEQCMQRNIKLVHFSTDYVFAGKEEDQHTYANGYPEEAEQNPINYYGQTKWEGEQAIRNSGCEHLIIRLSWLCGAYGHNFVRTMLKFAEEKDEVQIVSDQWGSPTFTSDAVKNTLRLLDKGKQGTYHLTSKGLTSWADFARQIFEYAGIDIKVSAITSKDYPTKAERPAFSKLNTSKIEKVQGVELNDWKQGLKKLLTQLEKY